MLSLEIQFINIPLTLPVTKALEKQEVKMKQYKHSAENSYLHSGWVKKSGLQ
jgi:hypothetical protein